MFGRLLLVPRGLGNNAGLPDKISVDKSGSNKHALDHFNDQLPEEWQYEIRQIKYLNNICEQDHRFIKKRTKPMLGFKSFESAEATLAGIESIRPQSKDEPEKCHLS